MTDRGEFFLRISLELIEFVVISLFLNHLLNNIFLAICISILIVHTFNWLTNGNIWALLIFSFPNLKNPGEKKTCAYLNSMADRLKRWPCITGLAVFGSVSRHMWHEKSDIDIRILRKAGFVNLFFAFLLTIRERFLALIHRQPLDLFLADDVTFLQKMRADERPVFLIKRDIQLDRAYPENPEIILENLC